MLAQQLKSPLIQINHIAETAEQTALADVAVLSSQALRAIDAYLLLQQAKLSFEPVSIGAVLYDVAHDLSPLARQYNVDIEIDSRGRAGSILAHKPSLQALIALLGEVFVQAPRQTARPIIIGAHRSATGIVAGVFAQDSIGQASLTAVRKLRDRTQGLAETGTHGQASLLIADSLAEALGTTLNAYRHSKVSGLGARLVPSRQLRFVTT